MLLVCVTCSRMILIISVNSPLKAPSQQNQLLGRPLAQFVYKSDAKRCVSLCTVQIEKSRSLVCRSLSPLIILHVSTLALEMAFIKKVLQKMEEPIGAPSTRRPSVTSQGIKFPVGSFVLEYLIQRVSWIVQQFRGLVGLNS